MKDASFENNKVMHKFLFVRGVRKKNYTGQHFKGSNVSNLYI